MGFKNFKFNVGARLLAIVITSYAIFETYTSDIIFLAPMLVAFLLGLQIISFIKYIDKSNREIVNFLNSIKYDDLGSTYPTDSSNSTINKLNEELNKVIKRFQLLRKEREADFQYLKNIVQHVGIGLITFIKESGDIQIINTAAKKILKVSRLDNVKELSEKSQHLVDSFYMLKTGGRDLVRLEIGGEIIQLAVYAIELTLRGEDFKLVSIQNIQNELEEKEMEAWQNLVRVLTHEIMNSITPIQSLAATVETELDSHISSTGQINSIPQEDIEDIHLAVQTIQKRSKGLIRFVQDFRNLTHTPKPKIKSVKVKALLNHINVLMQQEIQKQQVTLEVKIEPESFVINVDKELIEQVLINLIKNALQAFEDKTDRRISLSAYKSEKGRPTISVKDNGVGIDDEALQKIFIPFFTTKKSGSGIGLSLSRQIMRLHQGIIAVKSTPNEGTEFILKF